MIKTGDIDIQRGSDFKLKVVRWVDELGNPKDPNTEYFRAVFIDKNNSKYICESDPANGMRENTVVRGGKLYLIFQNHCLHSGILKYIDYAKIADNDFKDGNAIVSGPMLSSGITVTLSKKSGLYSVPEFEIEIIQ